MSRHIHMSLLAFWTVCAFASAAVQGLLDGSHQTLHSRVGHVERYHVDTTATGHYDDLDDSFVEQLLQDLSVACTVKLCDEHSYAIESVPANPQSNSPPVIY